MAHLSSALIKRYPSFGLEVDLRFEPGITALVGPSGSGKTTVIRCLAGLEKPDAGSIRIGEELWFDAKTGRFLPPQKRQVGFVFNDYALFPQMTVAQNVGYGAKSPAKAAEALELLELGELRGRMPRELSAGQQQRVAIARAIACDPRMLVMDEPFSSLDTHLKERLYKDIANLLRRLGIPVVLVTHDLAEACLLAREMIVLSGGRCLQKGSPDAVLLKPQTLEVAQLAGVRNVFEAEVDAQGILRFGTHLLKTDHSGPPARLRWCIRADCVQFDNGINRISAVVREVVLAGRGYRVVAHVEGAGDLEVMLPLSLGAPVPGQAIGLRLAPEFIHFIDTLS